MEKNYNKEELYNYTVPELRKIAKSRELKRLGRKDELIERILDSQNITGTYFSQLPSDINRFVGQLLINNNFTNRFFQQLNNKEILLSDKYIQQLEHYIKLYKLDINIIRTDKGIKFKVGHLPSITIPQFENLVRILLHSNIVSQNMIVKTLEELGISGFYDPSADVSPIGPTCRLF